MKFATVTNLKIATRLLLGFGVLIVMAALMAVLGARAVATLGNHIDTITHDHLSKTMDTVDIRETVNEIARAAHNLALITNAEQRAQEAQRITKADKLIARNFERLEANIGSAEGQQLLKKALAARTHYATVRERALQLGAKEEAQSDFAQALYQDLRPAQNAFISALDDIVQYQTERMDASAKLAHQQARTATRVLIGIGLLVLIIGIVLSIWIGRSIAGPARSAAGLTQAIAAGDLSHPVHAGGNDEMGQLLASLENMRAALTQEVRAIRVAAENVGRASAEISHASADLTGRAAAQAANLEQTAANMQHLTATVKQNTEHARRADSLAAGASAVATRGGSAVRGVVDTMHGISESSRKISDIIGVIDSIAFQTNLLALNAAVEAARAGEQGRGFAVVAGEVRALAQRSADAAKQIKSLIQQSTVQIDDGAARVEHAGKTMDEIVAAVRQVTGIISEISVASEKQLSGIEQVTQAVAQIEIAMQRNAAVVEESSTAAAQLSQQADTLVAAVARFNLGETREAPLAPASAQAPLRAPASTRTLLGKPSRHTALPPS